MTSAIFGLAQIKPDITLPGVETDSCFLTSEGKHSLKSFVRVDLG
jgi:hypothetical protein